MNRFLLGISRSSDYFMGSLLVERRESEILAAKVDFMLAGLLLNSRTLLNVEHLIESFEVMK